MAYLVLFLALFAGIVLCFVILLRKFVHKERAGMDRLEANLAMLNLDFDKLAMKKAGNLTQDKEQEPTSSDSWEYPPEKEKTIAYIDGGERAPGSWDYAISFGNGAEEYLGAGLFKGLEKRISSLPGVDNCLLKDGKDFLVRSQTFTEEILIELIWREYLHAAELAHMKRQNSNGKNLHDSFLLRQTDCR